jgi:hypothetical protein
VRVTVLAHSNLAWPRLPATNWARAAELSPVSNRVMRRLYLPSAFLAFSLLACGQPDAPPLPTAPNARDKGFPISARQPCTEDARAALRSVDPIAIAKAAAHGVKFTCGEVDGHWGQPQRTGVDRWKLAADRARRRAEVLGGHCGVARS